MSLNEFVWFVFFTSFGGLIGYSIGYQSACRNNNIITGKDAERFDKMMQENSTKCADVEEYKKAKAAHDRFKIK